LIEKLKNINTLRIILKKINILLLFDVFFAFYQGWTGDAF